MKSLSNVALVFDIDGVIRDVAGSYRRALADTVEHFTAGNYRPTPEDIDLLKSEGIWNNDWEASQELIQRYRSGKIAPAQQTDLDSDINLDPGQSTSEQSVTNQANQTNPAIAALMSANSTTLKIPL
jgi:HAD superfamily phosphatase